MVVDHIKARESQKRGGAGILIKKNATDVAEATEAKAEAEDAPSSGGPGKGRWKRIPLEDVSIDWQNQTIDLLDLAQAVEELGVEGSRLREVVMLHWFGGMKYADVATILGVSASTVEKDFRYALAWLGRRLSGDAQGANPVS